MKILGIDSASTAGFCLLDGERILEKGAIDARDPHRIDALAALVCGKARPDLVAIEDNFLGVNVNVVKVLSRIVGRFEQAFAMRGVPTELVLASTWQRALLAGLPGGTKRACATWVRATYGLTVPEDVADAIGLATFVARRELVAQRLAGVGALPRAAI
jgi:Holliday junction resolvasome RuvABC endonuclease subunit